MKPTLTYRDAGVDIEAADNLVDFIRPLAASTSRKEVAMDIGGFGGAATIDKERYPDPVLIATTDGVGTKLRIAFDMDKHETIGIDLVAMCVNDVIVHGAEPLFFLDYFATGRLDLERAKKVLEVGWFSLGTCLWGEPVQSGVELSGDPSVKIAPRSIYSHCKAVLDGGRWLWYIGAVWRMKHG